MRTTSIYLLVFLTPFWLCAQLKKSLNSKGTDCFIKGDKDAALRYLKKSFKSEPEHREFSLYLIANIEYEKGLKKEAEEKYKEVLTTYSTQKSFLKYHVQLTLADILIERMDYAGALMYLRNSDPYSMERGCGTGRFDRLYHLNYKYAVCFAGLNLTDSAISRLSPFMFKETYSMWGNPDRDQFYYNLLLKKYGICEVKDEMIKALNNLNYSNRFDYNWTRDPNMRRISCSLLFFGHKIPITEFGTNGAEDYYPYSKQGFIDRIKNSSLYMLIAGGSDF